MPTYLLRKLNNETIQQLIAVNLIISVFLTLLLLAGSNLTPIETTLPLNDYIHLVKRGVNAPALLQQPASYSLSEANKFCSTLPITKQNVDQYFVVLMIISAWGNSERRHTIRKTWAGYHWFKNKSMWNYTYKFVISKPDVSRQIEHPDDLHYDDILQTNLDEHYYLLDVKVAWGFSKMLQTHVFDYILKVDDDSFVNLQQLPEKIAKHIGNSEYLYGGHKLQTRRWSGREITYASGSGYLFNRKAACAVVYAHAAYCRSHNRIPIEDAYTGLLGHVMGIPLTPLSGFATEHESCKDFTTVVFHHLDHRVFRKLLRAAVNGTHFC